MISTCYHRALSPLLLQVLRWLFRYGRLHLQRFHQPHPAIHLIVLSDLWCHQSFVLHHSSPRQDLRSSHFCPGLGQLVSEPWLNREVVLLSATPKARLAIGRSKLLLTISLHPRATKPMLPFPKFFITTTELICWIARVWHEIIRQAANACLTTKSIVFTFHWLGLQALLSSQAHASRLLPSKWVPLYDWFSRQ